MKLILGVDDSKMNRVVVEEAASLLGVEVKTAANGCEALDSLESLVMKNKSPRLIITDMIMPKMGGLELIEEIKKQDQLKFIPILVLTTEQDFKLMEQSKKLGATGWIEKPILPEELAEVIKDFL